MAYSTTSSANGSSSPWSTASSSRTRQPVLASGKRSPLAAKSTHPLRTNYTFTTTYRVPGAKTDEQDWASHIRTLAQVGSIESFWVIWTHLKLPSELEIGREYHLFREGVRPIWEDASNHEGGKAILRLRKGVSDRVWLDLVLAMIGERLLSDSAESRRRLPRLGEAEETDPSDDICGCTLSIRKDEDVITVWNRDHREKERLKEAVVRALRLNYATAVTYKNHNASLKRLGQKKEIVGLQSNAL